MGGYISKSKKIEHDTVVYDYNKVAEDIKPHIIKILRISINRMLAINQYFLQKILLLFCQKSCFLFSLPELCL